MYIWRMHSVAESQHHLHITVWSHHRVDDPSQQILENNHSSQKFAESVVSRTLKQLPFRNYFSSASTTQPAFTTSSKFINDVSFVRMTVGYFHHPDSQLFRKVKPLLEVLCAASLPVPRSIVESIFEGIELTSLLLGVSPFIHIDSETNCIQQQIFGWLEWLGSIYSAGDEFWVDIKAGHNRLAALFLKFCANKSISIEHTEQEYLVSTESG